MLQSLATRLVEFEKHYAHMYSGIYQRSTTCYATTTRDKTQFCILCMLHTAVHSAECELHMFMNLNCMKVEQDETDLDVPSLWWRLLAGFS